ncbi:nuclear transport factor 2 family protein [Tumebacillus sp. ITR2]|uniref:Nuclear transport factor 2 family protein n=1 Tax=Tumebacillus amylolyticus TaxID=2801339 RepID=A0ABS1JBY3_9BACL|nr:nuclear transport factor 2 family protein [Tumebacillus amylolyticus]MBL0387782.1 nuclear transport factor 2 family protein [Tumebacillus amylolyticus]
MHPNKQLLINFYTAIQNNDVEALSDCYHEELHDSDEILDDLYSNDARAMVNWFVSTREKARVLGFRILDVTETHGRARWEIEYRSARSGRIKRRDIESEFRFENGKIVWHHDYFDWGRWARRAFGPEGTVVSWGPIVDRVEERVERVCERVEDHVERIDRKVRRTVDDYRHNWNYGIDINVNGKEIRITTGKRRYDR